MGDIYLIRHGETKWNAGGIFRGRADIPLNDKGKKQAKAVGKALSGLEFAAVYASPLSRAIETASEVSAPHGIEPEIDDGLIDINYGEWEGVSNNEVREKYPDLHKQWLNAPQTVTFPGGESIVDVAERALKATIKLARRQEDETIALVSHRVPNKMILIAVMGINVSRFWDIEQDTACINVLRYVRKNDRFIVAKVNDTSPTKPFSTVVDADF